ncbi:MAG: sugar transferase [Roseibium sp.]|uniref:sugar transferase n=1 Tax=Roseibium sp. TaxID=1936156 RepID=UPI002625A5AF|nr:sugar transferase [Roseibium sp.]MCV0423844.1 sugar transferase [Roseibium sp.]
MTNDTVTNDADDHCRHDIVLAEYANWQRRLKRKLVSTSHAFPKRTSCPLVQRILKRSVDLFGATAGLALLFPLLATVALIIKMSSPGPVFFRQKRYGLNGIPFTIFKFRTMHVHLCDASGVAQTVANDPRITPIGFFLRKSNFDELPQLINVLKGDMSLVGPRPHVPGMLAVGVPYEIFDQRYMGRHHVRPGITGLAQVNGCRGETKTELSARMRLEYDLIYVQAQSFWLDATILVKTIVREFFKGSGS